MKPGKVKRNDGFDFIFLDFYAAVSYNQLKRGGSNMAAQPVRMPRQKRSMETRDAILQAGYALFSEKGYYKTNTAEIAKRAGVSTGIVYSYFHDKKDILKEVVKLYAGRLETQFDRLLPEKVEREALPSLVEGLMEACLASHTMERGAHDEFLALALLEPDIGALFDTMETRILHTLEARMEQAGCAGEGLAERLRIGYGLVERFCHDCIGGKIPQEHRARAGQWTARAVLSLFDGPV